MHIGFSRVIQHSTCMKHIPAFIMAIGINFCAILIHHLKLLAVQGPLHLRELLPHLEPIGSRRFQDLEIRRAFTVFQLMNILEEARHSLIIIEHDPLLYEDVQGMVEYVSQGLHDAAKMPQSCFTHLEPIRSWRI